MALITKSGTFSPPSPNSTANIVVRGVGFTPTALLLWSSQRYDGPNATTLASAEFSIGVGTKAQAATQQLTIHSRDPHGAVSPATSRNENRLFQSEGWGFDLSTFDADGFTLSVPFAGEARPLIHYLAFGGTTFAKAGQWAPTVGTGTFDVNVGGGVTPDFVLLFAGGYSTEFLAAVGAATSAAKQACSVLQVRHATNSVVQTYQRSDHIMLVPKLADGTVGFRIQFDSFLLNGFRLNKIENNSYGAPAEQYTYLAFTTGGGGVDVGTLLTQTGTGPFSETGLTFKPKNTLLFSTGTPENANPAALVTGSAGFSMGVAENNVEQRSAWSGSLHNVNPHVASSAVSKQEVYQNKVANGGVPTTSGLATLSSVNNDGFTLNQTDADPAQAFGWYVAFGDTAVSDTPGTTKVGAFDPEVLEASLFDEEIQEVSLFDRELVTAEAGADQDISANVATLALTAAAPTVAASNNISANVATLALTAEAPTVTTSNDISANVATLALTAAAPTVAASNDISADLATLALTAAAPTVAQTGAVRFDSHADRLRRSTNVPSPANVTVTMWARLRVDRNADSTLFSIENTDSSSQLALVTNNTGTMMRVQSGFQDVNLVEMTPDTWYFIAMTSDGVNPKGYYKLEGSGGLTSVTLGSFFALTQTKFIVGSAEVFGSKFWNGRIAGLKIWDAVLSEAELAEEATSLSAGRTADLNSSFLFDTADTKLTDGSGNGRDLTAASTGPWETEGPGPDLPDLIKANTASLALTAAEPTVTATADITPNLATLSLSAFQPTVSTTAAVIPDLATLSLSAFQPTVSTTAAVTPDLATLSLSAFQPTVSTLSTVTPDLATLSLSAFQPTVLTADGITSDLAAISLSAFQPTVSTVALVTPDLATLSLSAFQPTVSNLNTVSPDLATLSLSAFQPTVSTAATVIPDLATLSLSAFQPSVSTAVAPNLATLSLSAFQPTVSAVASITPDLATLSLSAFQPTVSNLNAVSPDLATLALSAYQPTVTPGVATITPDVATLGITVHLAQVDQEGGPVFVTPNLATLSLSAFAATVSTTASVTPDLATLGLSAEAPTVAATNVVSPSLATLALTAATPTVSATADVSANLATLSLSAFDPTVTATSTVAPTLAVLSFTAPPASITTTTTISASVANIPLTAFDPTVAHSGPQEITAERATLALSFFAPTVSSTAEQEILGQVAVLALSAKKFFVGPYELQPPAAPGNTYALEVPLLDQVTPFTAYTEDVPLVPPAVAPILEVPLLDQTTFFTATTEDVPLASPAVSAVQETPLLPPSNVGVSVV